MSLAVSRVQWVPGFAFLSYFRGPGRYGHKIRVLLLLLLLLSFWGGTTILGTLCSIQADRRNLKDSFPFGEPPIVHLDWRVKLNKLDISGSPS